MTTQLPCRERLNQIANFHSSMALPPSHDEIEAMARFALAAHEQEPVAYMYRDNLHTDARFSLDPRFGNWSPEDISEYEISETPLYTHPAPVPAAPDEVLAICQRLIKEYIANKGTSSEFICCVTPSRKTIGTGGVWDDWRALDKACRAAMLNGGKS